MPAPPPIPPNPTSQTIRIDVYRPLNGIRTPYILLLDQRRNVVSDEVDEAALNRILESPYLLGRHLVDEAPGVSVQAAQTMRKMGLHAEHGPRGLVVSRVAPSEFSSNFSKWLVSTRPNTFEGTDALRAAYFAEKKALDKKVKAGECAPCELSALIATYRAQLKAL